MERIIIDPEMGNVIFKKQASNKHYVIRLKGTKVVVSLPLIGSYRRAMEVYQENREKILNLYRLAKAREIPEYDKEILKKKALLYLPERLDKLAGQYGFSYQSLKITRSRSRWGACSSKGVIHLSFYLMLLPEHLIDYVILHELCHTHHMNHSPLFWSLLDSQTGGNARALRKELKDYRCF